MHNTINEIEWRVRSVPRGDSSLRLLLKTVFFFFCFLHYSSVELIISIQCGVSWLVALQKCWEVSFECIIAHVDFYDAVHPQSALKT